VPLAAYLVRRLLAALALLCGVTAITFLLFYAIPQNPGTFLVGPPHASTPDAEARYEKALAAANHQLGADRPLYVQYATYLRRLATGSFGDSYATGREVRGLLARAGRVTVALVAGGIVVLLLIAVPLGTLAALRAGSAVDRFTLALGLVGASLPPFLVSIVLLRWLSPRIGFTQPLFGASGVQGPQRGYCPLSSHLHGCGGLAGWTQHLLLPWVAFALGLVALYARMVRSGLLEALSEPHVRTARAKGAGEWRVLRSHVLRNALPPLLTMLSMDIGLALGTVLYVEVVFGLPGFGAAAYQAIVDPQVGFDLPVIAGVVLVSATVVLTLNLLVDVVSSLVDPRIRLGARG
jgi:peptide/nickel transport system permease protein